MLKKIAVTGGMGTGKTTVCRFLQELGAFVVFSDEIVKKLLQNPVIQKKISSSLSTLPDLKTLKKIVLQDPEKLKKLEDILHPEVFKEIEKKAQEAEKKGGLFVAEIPLLYEVKAEPFYDLVLAVVANEEISKKRCMQKGFEEEEFTLRMQRQLHPDIKAKKADYVILNEGSLASLKEKVIDFYQTLLS